MTKANLALKAEQEQRDSPRRQSEIRAKFKEYKKALRAKDEQNQELLNLLKTITGLFEREKSEKERIFLMLESSQIRQLPATPA